MPSRHQETWNRFKRKKDREARAELIHEFIPLVHYVYGRMSIYLPQVLDNDDLIAAGTIGLISAVDDFDIDRGIEFTTFAVPRVRGAILDELREHDWVPRTARRRAAELKAAMNEASDENARAPDLGKVARLLGVERSRLSRLIYRVQPVSFVPLEHSAGQEDDEAMSVSQVVADPGSEDPVASVELDDDCRTLEAALETLPEVERNVIVDYYFEERMQKDIAKELQVSRSRVSQIHNHAITTLRERMESAGAA
ncbi:MAG: FliA/WhiG family RNA polymerase sigma factor [Planctomycetota bacterium]